MATFGLCAPLSDAERAKEAGFDYIEPSVQQYLRGETADDEFEQENSRVLPAPIYNMLVPGHLKVTGPDRDAAALQKYMERVLRRAGKLKAEKVIFGSGAARTVPEEFDRDVARSQILEFLQMVGPIGRQHGVVVVVEPLRREECNILNGVAEVMTYVREVAHPNVKCLVDSYHHWVSDESIADVADGADGIVHVHVADKHGRCTPGQAEIANPVSYEDFFRPLKQRGYDGGISIESSGPHDLDTLVAALDLLRHSWASAS
jgi:sugar phosphate isomerase/epimerase